MVKNLLTYSLHFFCKFCFCNFSFFSLHFVLKNYYAKTNQKWCFIISIAILFYFFIILKINLRSYTTLLIDGNIFLK